MKVQRSILILWVALLLSVPAYALGGEAEPGAAAIDKEYILKHYPEVYQQIFMEGKASALKGPGAQEAAQAKPSDVRAAEDKAAPGKETPGDWWNRSSLEYDPRPVKPLYHLELQYGYSRDTGNTDAYAHKGGGKFIVRLDRFTNSLSYLINKSKQTAANTGNKTVKNYQIFEESLQYDITKKLFAMGGLIREVSMDDALNRRYSLYGGMGYPVLALKSHKADLFLAYAYLDEKYDSVINSALGFDGRTYSAVYFDQSYKWMITDRILFSERFRIIHSLEDFTRYDMDARRRIVNLGDKKRDLIVFSLGLDFKIADSFTVFSKYEVNYDNVPWPTVLKKDTTFASGVKVGF